LKGKSAPVAAFRLLAVTGEPERRRVTPMVGRERQQRLLQEAFAHAAGDRACQLFTILGAAGVGKSRLAEEFLDGIDATVVRGRCLSYGEGITYWPVVEVLRQLGTRPADDAAAAAVASLLGEPEEPATVDQIAWAVRRTLEEAAVVRPLVCVLDDLHWAEPVLLDLVEHVADWSRDAPILLLCMARPELLDRRPGWPGGKLNATTALLEPLSEPETDELIERLLGDATIAGPLRARIREAADGNPLFVEEMLAMVRESENGDIVVPPTIQALLAARIDQLDTAERTVLERGAVEGKVFHRTAVEALAPDEQQMPARLLALVRKELVRPDQTRLMGDDAFRFRHLLIRDAAYDGLPKSVRAELHERFAGWLEERDADLVERDEILGYHLEQAHKYRSELGVEDDHTTELASRASGLLAPAGRRALMRYDPAGAAALLERALSLLPPTERPIEMELDYLDALDNTVEPLEWEAKAEAMLERRRAAGDKRGELLTRLTALWAAIRRDPRGRQEELVALADEAVAQFEESGDEFGLTWAWLARAHADQARSRMGDLLVANREMLRHARAIGDERAERTALMNALFADNLGPTPIDEALAHLDEYPTLERFYPDITGARAMLVARLGRFDDARRLFEDAVRTFEERGLKRAVDMSDHNRMTIERIAGNAEAAEQLGRRASTRLEADDEQAFLSTTVCYWGDALYALDRYDEALECAERGRRLGADDDAITQMLWRQLKAKVLARRGEHAEAAALARAAIAAGEGTEMLDAQAAAYTDLAEVLILAGEGKEATRALEQARALYARKGNVVGERNVRKRLGELGAAATH
jgi:tetratricopeptide (TPR) repeat protein